MAKPEDHVSIYNSFLLDFELEFQFRCEFSPFLLKSREIATFPIDDVFIRSSIHSIPSLSFSIKARPAIQRVIVKNSIIDREPSIKLDLSSAEENG